jgi:hypothetical protein
MIRKSVQRFSDKIMRKSMAMIGSLDLVADDGLGDTDNFGRGGF